MQKVLDAYLIEYNTKRRHQGRNMNGRTPAKASIDGLITEKDPQPKFIKKAA
jgi:hypothetical protein